MDQVLSILIYCLVRVHIEHSTKVKVKSVGKKARLSKNKLGHSVPVVAKQLGFLTVSLWHNPIFKFVLNYLFFWQFIPTYLGIRLLQKLYDVHEENV